MFQAVQNIKCKNNSINSSFLDQKEYDFNSFNKQQQLESKSIDDPDENSNISHIQDEIQDLQSERSLRLSQVVQLEERNKNWKQNIRIKVKPEPKKHKSRNIEYEIEFLQKKNNDFAFNDRTRQNKNMRAKSILERDTEKQEYQNKLILGIINRNPSLGIKDISNKLSKDYNLLVKPSKIHKKITQEMGFQYRPLTVSYSLVSTLNSQQVILQRAKFCRQIKEFKLEKIVVCGFSTFLLNNKNQFAWVQDSKYQERGPIYFGQRDDPFAVNVILTLTIKGVLNFDLFTGPFTSSVLINHLRKGLMSLNNSKRISDQILLISNQISSILTKSKLQGTQAKLQIDSKPQQKNRLGKIVQSLYSKYLVLPPFSPRISPCYRYFQLMHKKFKAYKTLKKRMINQEHIKVGIFQCLKHMPSSVEANFVKIDNYIKLKQINLASFTERDID